MKLSEFVKKYREENDLSQREFAKRAHLTNGYIWQIENEKNPKTGLPVKPSIQALYGLARAMNMSLDSLIKSVDDMPVSLVEVTEKADLTEEEAALTEALACE